MQHFEQHFNFSFAVFVSACIHSPDVTVAGCCALKAVSPESVCLCTCVCVCACECACMCVWPCVPLLSAVILPASGFDKDQHCGGKWINSCLHCVSVCMLRFCPCDSTDVCPWRVSSCIICASSCVYFSLCKIQTYRKRNRIVYSDVPGMGKCGNCWIIAYWDILRTDVFLQLTSKLKFHNLKISDRKYKTKKYKPKCR